MNNRIDALLLTATAMAGATATGVGLDMAGISAWIADLASLSLWAFQWGYRIFLTALAGATLIALGRGVLLLHERQAINRHEQAKRQLELASLRADIAVKMTMNVITKQGETLWSNQDLIPYFSPVAPQLPPGRADVRGDAQGSDQKYLDIGEFISGLEHATTYNLRMTGDTQRGKTTLVLNLLAEIIKPLREAEIYVVDPKYLDWKHKGKWGNLAVACDDIQNVLPVLEQVHQNAFSPRLDAEHPPAFVILDETDWLYSEFGNDYLAYINQWSKVGSEANFFVWLIGQSALVKSTGIDTALQQNFNHVALGKTAYQAIKQAENITEKPERDALLGTLKTYEGDTKYFGAMGQLGQWQAFKTPKLSKPKIVTTVDVGMLNDNEPSEPTTTEETIQQMHNEGKSKAAICRALGWNVGGKQYKRINEALSNE